MKYVIPLTMVSATACADVNATQHHTLAYSTDTVSHWAIEDGLIESVNETTKSEVTRENQVSKNVAILNDHSMSLNLSLTGPSAEEQSSKGERTKRFFKALSRLSEHVDLGDDVIEPLIELHDEVSCTVDSVMLGKLKWDDFGRGEFEFSTYGLIDDQPRDFFEGRIYSDKHSGMLVSSEGILTAFLRPQNTDRADAWLQAVGLGKWTDSEGLLGERFLVLDGLRIIGFETMCF